VQSLKRPDPAPSRWAYRFQRLMLTPLFRRALRTGLPLAVTGAMVATYFADEARREQVTLAVADLRASIEARPEFRVDMLAIEGASDEVEAEIREILPLTFPISSFDLDLDAMRDTIAGLDAVESASLRLRPGGVLMASVTERVPVAIWRTRAGLALIDAEGVVVGPIASRAERFDLPVIAGQGANDAVAEARALVAASLPLGERFRGIVRVGERRWDVVLDRDQRILLPETGAVRALERVIVLNEAQDLLARDLAAVDMRLAERPTIRLNPHAVEELWRIRQVSVGE